MSGFYDDLQKNKFSEEDVIDRVQENKDVIEYQKTKDICLFEKLYKQRLPTLRYWALKHYFPGLSLSIDDFFSELSIVFVKAVEGYKKNRGSFNTCLYTFLLNRIKNIKSGRHAKKRKSAHYDGPLSGMILSLDFGYDDEDGNKVDLMAKLENECSVDYHNTMNSIHFNESIDSMTNNSFLKDVFVKLGNGATLSNVIREYKQRDGMLPVSRYYIKTVGNNKKKIKALLAKKLHIKEDFSVVKCEIKDNDLHYVVELKKTNESDMIIKTIRRMRKEKFKYKNMFL